MLTTREDGYNAHRGPYRGQVAGGSHPAAPYAGGARREGWGEPQHRSEHRARQPGAPLPDDPQARQGPRRGTQRTPGRVAMHDTNVQGPQRSIRSVLGVLPLRTTRAPLSGPPSAWPGASYAIVTYTDPRDRSRYSDQRRRGAGRGWHRHAGRRAAVGGDAGDGHARYWAGDPPRWHPELLALRQPARPAGQRDLGARGRGAPGPGRTPQALRRRPGAALLEGRELGQPGVRHDEPPLLRGAAHNPGLLAGRYLGRLRAPRHQERAGLRCLALVRLGPGVGGAAIGWLGPRRARGPDARRGALRVLHGRAHDPGDDLDRWRAAPGPRAWPPGAQGDQGGEHAARAGRGPAPRGARALVAALGDLGEVSDE